MAMNDLFDMESDKSPIAPSPHRVRNILTLEERVQAIHAYDKKPMYTKVAKMFNCSWEQIKNIINNRKATLEFYAATKSSRLSPDQDVVRQRKIKFLGECMYEYIQRVQYHTKIDITEALIRTKAFEFRNIIQVDNFTPNKTWMNHFKATYNFSLSNRQITLTRAPPPSLDLKDIMTYCSKNRTNVPPVSNLQAPVKNLYKTKTKMDVANANLATMVEMKERHLRKVNFLEKALLEYIQRAQYHHKVPLHDDGLRSVAYDLREMLKIHNFIPSKEWLNQFKSRFKISQNGIVLNRTPPFSLDLKDILSYCGRNENKNQSPVTVKLAPKESERPLKRPASVLQPQPVVQIHTMDLKQTTTREKRKTSPSPLPAMQQKPPQGQSQNKIKEEVIDLDPDEVEHEDIKPDPDELVALPESERNCEPPPLKIHKIESIGENNQESRTVSPGHWSEHSDNEEEPLPKQVRNYGDALKLLKPLEEFAMLEENYRVIGLISQLEDIFKNPPKKSNSE